MENGHNAVAKILSGMGQTSVSDLHLDLHHCSVPFSVGTWILWSTCQHGANKKLRLDDGQTVEDFAKGKAAITTLLRSSQVIQGPSLTAPEPIDSERRFMPIPSLPANQVNKQDTCHGFEASTSSWETAKKESKCPRRYTTSSMERGQKPSWTQKGGPRWASSNDSVGITFLRTM